MIIATIYGMLITWQAEYKEFYIFTQFPPQTSLKKVF